jgi:glycosyltransferase involved in cell wall biosynthesis
MTRRLKNMVLLDALRDMDAGVAPTAWQASRLPDAWRRAAQVIHDGIDTDTVRPDARASFRHPALPGVLSAADQVVTFVCRSLEPYRGFHAFMRAVPGLLERLPGARVVIVSAEGWLWPRRRGRTWKQIVMAESAAGWTWGACTSLAGGYPDYLRLRCRRPRVPDLPGRGCLEAMAAGATDRQRTINRGVHRARVNRHLVDFFDAENLVAAVAETIENRKAYAELQERARQTVVERCDAKEVCLPSGRPAGARHRRAVVWR